MTPASTLPPGTLVAGKFRIEKLLGAGAMGAVYQIEHELTFHRRALKLLHPGIQNDPDLVRRFLNEASAAGRAGSPHLVETFDAGTLPTGEPYVVMELLDGETLGSLLARVGPLPVEQAAELVAQAAEGIEAAHHAGIIHRDLKPENLFLTSRDGRPFVKILDFGISKFKHSATKGDARATRVGAILGSPSYMSREQVLAVESLDARTDVFSLGVVLFEALSGRLPIEAETIEGLMVKVAVGEATPIESLRPELPSGLVDIVRRATASDRGHRIPSASALAEALSPFRKIADVAPATVPAAPAPQSRVASIASPAASTLSASSIAGVPAEPPPRRLGMWFGAAAGALVLALIGFGLSSGRSTPRADPTPTRSGPVVADVALLPPTASASATIVATADAAPTSVASVIPERSARPRLAPSTGAPSASAKPPPRPSAENLGLSQDNPFR